MRQIEVVIIAFFVILFHASALSQTIQTSHLSLQEATKESWAPGIISDNTTRAGGMRFILSLTARKNKISFDHVITDDSIIPIEINYLGVRNAKGPFKKNKRIEIIALTNAQVTRTRAPDDVITLLKEKNLEGVLQYTYKGKKYFLPISVFTKRTGQPLPR